MDSLRRLSSLLVATGLFWLMAVLAMVIFDIPAVTAAAAILAILGTVTLWSLWALDAYGISVDGTPRETIQEKAKRDDEMGGDARLATLLALLTPDERDALRDRLVDDLSGDGEAVSLADLLAEDEASDAQTGHAR